MLPNPEGIIARASNVSLDVARLPRLSMLLAVATVLLLLPLPCACFLFPRVSSAAQIRSAHQQLPGYPRPCLPNECVKTVTQFVRAP